MVLPPQNQLGWEISVTILHFLAMSATVVRVAHRFRAKLAWWDDYVVVIPLVFDFTFILLFWLEYKTDKVSWLVPESNVFIFSWWFICFLAISITWFSRISLSLSLARLFLPGHLFRRCALGYAVVLFVLYLAILLMATFDCRGSPWWQLDLSHCINFKGSFAGDVVVIGFTVDFASDIILIAAPLYMLWNISFPSTQRILILVLFSSSVLTLSASALYCGLYFGASRAGSDSRLLYTMMGHLQVSISLLACNLLVVVMLIYNQVRIWREPPRVPGRPHLGADQTTTTLGFRDSHPTDPEPQSFSTLTLTSISEHTGSYSNSITQDVPLNEVTESHLWLAAKSERPENLDPPL